ncbi:FxsA family protein [Paracoccus sp. 1_MG-2023]|uniref:FxsA family protein n=1 Tax=unclassified Paracoccus (in: a-proteobacteria) TaxID=2688777 RepID=UPI001C08A06E|nr:MULTISPECIES: FxsA family protein [unclassified Paracoccus (in: a-proteobacteria)]MBU2957198.1 FxsA family protein [Paracoccus sp. C2R09]MDO6669085.1 FxsA family protein [Paracoccus sp. 1_MG-2023]
MKLFWLFLLVPIIEIGLFIQVGGLIGLWPTLAIVVLTAIVGTALMRSQGAQAWLEIQRSFGEMRDPTRPLAHGVMILIAGMLLLTPGFFTDTLGMLLLVPGVRDRLMRQIAGRVKVTGFQMNSATMGRNPYRAADDEGVIDGDYTVTPEDRRDPVDLPPELDDPSRGPGRSGWTRH